MNMNMKRTITVISLLIATVAISSAQEKNSFGLKAGANISSFLLYDMEGTTSMKGGFEVCGFWKHDFGKYFALQPEVAITLQQSDYKFANSNQDYRFWSLEIPVYALGQLITDEGHRAYIGVGPNFSVGFGDKEKISGNKLFREGSLMNRFDVGASVLIGYEFAFNMQINMSYRYGFFNALANPVGDSRMIKNSVSLGIGYRF